MNTKLASSTYSTEDQDAFRRELQQRESEYLRQLRCKISLSQFEKITSLGHGAYGQVYLVRYLPTQQLYAMKCLQKAAIIQKNQLQYLKIERDLMASSFSNWLVKLHSSFQDDSCLYMIMDYAPGGDLMGLLMRHDRLPEQVARFYVAEIVLAFNDLHKNSVIYRDGKPDNILISASGHLRLTDFGLSCRAEEYQAPLVCTCEVPQPTAQKTCALCQLSIDAGPGKRSRLQAFSTVGTQNYTAVEVLRKERYTEKCDYWAAGCILFECLFGYAPFASDSWRETRKRILGFQKALVIPPNKVSKPCEDFIRGLICEPEQRFGFEDIVQHEWMKPINFQTLQKQKPPFVPKLQSETDTQYFDQAGEQFQPAQVEEKWWDDGAFAQFSHRAFPQTQVQQKGRPSIKQFFGTE